MNIRYVLLAALVLILGLILVILPEKERVKEIKPELLLAELQTKTHYISTDEIAERLINQDPAVFLIDVRMADSYFEYSLPGAENIPLEEILFPDWEDYLAQDGKDIIFFSNDDILAEQAWMFARQKGYKNLYVMKGGLNEWFSTIIQPTPPAETASNKEFELYAFRKGAKIFFTGGQVLATDDSAPDVVVVARKKKKSVVEGGC